MNNKAKTFMDHLWKYKGLYLLLFINLYHHVIGRCVQDYGQWADTTFMGKSTSLMIMLMPVFFIIATPFYFVRGVMNSSLSKFTIFNLYHCFAFILLLIGSIYAFKAQRNMEEKEIVGKLSRFIAKSDMPKSFWGRSSIIIKVDGGKYDEIIQYGWDRYGKGIIGLKDGKVASRFMLIIPPLHMRGCVINSKEWLDPRSKDQGVFHSSILDGSNITDEDYKDIENLISTYCKVLLKVTNAISDAEFVNKYHVSKDDMLMHMRSISREFEGYKDLIRSTVITSSFTVLSFVSFMSQRKTGY